MGWFQDIVRLTVEEEARRIRAQARAAVPTSYVRYAEYGKAPDEDIIESTGYTIDDSALALPPPLQEELV